MHRHLQSGMCENPASNRRHGSRQVIRTLSDENCNELENATSPSLESGQNHSSVEGDHKPIAASPRAATVREERLATRLMTVQEVAQLLQVPTSWVYERTRLRCHNR